MYGFFLYQPNFSLSIFKKNFLTLIFRYLELKYFIGATLVEPFLPAKKNAILHLGFDEWQKMCTFVATFWRDFRCRNWARLII